MSSSLQGIENVSDTALVVAAVRAIESARPDALVRDQFAERVAGTRGMDMVREAPGLEWMCFGIGTRCRFMDELLLAAVGSGAIGTVLCLGAGLDTRPWRLDLPPRLRWVEVDFPGILNYKAEVLASTTPRCRVERYAADLNDRSQRQALFEQAGEGPGLITTEGLLMYLPAETVSAIARDSVRFSGIRHWLLDVASQDLMRRAHQDWQAIERLRPEGHLKGQLVLDAAQQAGWREVTRRTYTRDGWNVAEDRIRQMTGGETVADERNLATGGDPSGVYRFAFGNA